MGSIDNATRRGMTMFKVQYLSILNPGQWVDSHLGNFSSERRAQNASRAIAGYETRVVAA
jgi:hypothetical protein